MSVRPDALRIEREHGTGVYGSRGLTLVRGRGVTVEDDAGRTYVDATSMYGVSVLGHAHPELAAALAEQAGRLVSCFGSFANDRRAELLELLAQRLSPLDRFFLCNSGAEAVEAALKLARLATGRAGVVAATGGFHGRTFGALSATFRPEHRRPFEPLVPGFRHVPLDDEAALQQAVTDDVAAVVLEPVQGESGVRPASGAWLRAAERACRERGALLVLDEVQTGLGRTGRWFGFEHAGLEPDVVCLAKGIAGGVPMGAVALGPRVPKPGVGRHGSTFGGNPLACAAAVTTLRIIERDGLVDHARDLGAWALDRLQSIGSPRIRAVRGRGLMLAVELRERAAPLQRALQDRGVLVLGAGPTTIRLLPPLVITRAEMETVVEAVAEVLS